MDTKAIVRTIVRAGGAAACLVTLAGCGASIPGLSTSALSPKPAEPQNDTTARALQVGSTAARALKCGFNFDPVKLRTQFLAAEAVTAPAEIEKAGKIYDTAFNGVSKAVAGQGEAYCTEEKTADIRTSLTRHLAGDFSPAPPKAAVDEGGLFGDLGSSSSGDSDYRKKMEKGPAEW